MAARAHHRLALGFILPAATVVVFVYLFPMLFGAYLAVHHVTPAGNVVFVGGGNFTLLGQDPVFWRALANTGLWLFLVTGGSMALAFGSALLLQESFRGRGLCRVLTTVPWMIPTAVAVVIWGMIFQGQSGILNYLLTLVTGVEAMRYTAWLGNPATSLFAAMVVRIWKVFPFYGLTILAAMQAVPRDSYEAAHLDGATYLQRVRYITLPAIRPVLAVLVLLNFLWTFRSFEYVWILTHGGPIHSSEVLPTYLYYIAFEMFLTGRGSAIGLIMFAIILAFALAYLRLLRVGQEEPV
jgi:multiple sugar transport system permease protein